jgi:hypothetical protein
MIARTGAIGDAALSDAGRRQLASEWTGPRLPFAGEVVRGERRVRRIVARR